MIGHGEVLTSNMADILLNQFIHLVKYIKLILCLIQNTAYNFNFN